MAESGGNVRRPELCTVAFSLIYLTLANMKVITTIYLNCRPDLRDEWLTGSEADDTQNALVSDSCLW